VSSTSVGWNISVGDDIVTEVGGNFV